MSQVLILAAVVGVTAAVALWWRAREGRVRAVTDRFTEAERAGLQAPPGHRLLVEFTAPACAPCAAARRILDEAAAGRQDVTVRAVDVGERLDLARAHGVLRTPTTFALDPDGTVIGRIAGVPAAGDVRALLDAGAVARGRAA